MGRHEELERILGKLRFDSSDHQPMIVVGGEAGVGKTRLVEEAFRRVSESGYRVLSGGCINLGDAYPYAPFVEALRDLTSVRSGDHQDSLEIGDADLTRFLHPVAPTIATEATAGLSYTSPQASLFEGLLRLLVQLTETSPLLLAIEDLHWADRSSLDLLTFIIRNVHTKRLTLLATYRTDEVVRQHPLTAFLAELERSGRAERITLPRLTHAEVGQLLAAIQGEKPEPVVIDQIYSRSGGNPFFAEELLAAGLPTGKLPETLREVLLTRAASLSEGSREVLRVASASGRPVSGPLLAAVAGLDEGDLLPSLRESVSKQILVVEESGRAQEDGYVFRHALMQEAVYADLLPGERTLLHGRYARALSDSGESDDDHSIAGELAHHWYAAHDLPRAFESSILAGLDAESVFAFPEAQVHYERALELWDRVPDRKAHGEIDHVALLESAARAAAVIDPGRAIAHVHNAIKIMDPEVDPGRYGLLHEKLGMYRWEAGDSDGALSAYQEAVQSVPAEPPSVARAKALAGLAQVLMVIPRVEESRPIAEEAVRIAQIVKAPAVESHALNTLGMDLGYLGDVESGVASLYKALEMAVDLKDLENGSGRTSISPTCSSKRGGLRKPLPSALKARRFTKPIEWCICGSLRSASGRLLFTVSGDGKSARLCWSKHSSSRPAA